MCAAAAAGVRLASARVQLPYARALRSCSGDTALVQGVELQGDGPQRYQLWIIQEYFDRGSLCECAAPGHAYAITLPHWVF